MSSSRKEKSGSSRKDAAAVAVTAAAAPSPAKTTTTTTAQNSSSSSNASASTSSPSATTTTSTSSAQPSVSTTTTTTASGSGKAAEDPEMSAAASERLQSVADALLMQLSSPERSAQAISFVRETNTLQWMSKHPALFARFLGTCAARNHADILQHAAIVCPGCLASVTDKHGNTLLHFGARHGSLLTINRLLDLGTDPHVLNDKKETVLHVMARRSFIVQKPRMQFSLFRMGGDANAAASPSAQAQQDSSSSSAAAVSAASSSSSSTAATAAQTAHSPDTPPPPYSATNAQQTQSSQQQQHSHFSFGRHKRAPTDGGTPGAEATGAQVAPASSSAPANAADANTGPNSTPAGQNPPTDSPEGAKEAKPGWRTKASMYLQMHPFKKSQTPSAAADEAAQPQQPDQEPVQSQQQSDQQQQPPKEKSKVVEAFLRIPIFKKKTRSASSSPSLGPLPPPEDDDDTVDAEQLEGSQFAKEHSVQRDSEEQSEQVVDVYRPPEPSELSEATLADIDDDEVYKTNPEEIRHTPRQDAPSSLRHQEVALDEGGDSDDDDDSGSKSSESDGETATRTESGSDAGEESEQEKEEKKGEDSKTAVAKGKDDNAVHGDDDDDTVEVEDDDDDMSDESTDEDDEVDDPSPDEIEASLIMMAISQDQQKKDVAPSRSDSASPPASPSLSHREKEKEKKPVDWNKFSEDGSLASTVQKMKPEELLSFTVQRLCQSISPNSKNILGRTPLQLALKYNNEPMVKALRECGASIPNERAASRISKTGASIAAAMKRFSADSKGRYIQSVRDIIDKTPHREPLCRIVLKPRMKYRILSMDGGGVRCLMHPIIIRRILERYPKFLESTALFCGCSGSAAMASMFVLGYTAQQVLETCELSAMRTLKKSEGNGITGVKFTSQWLRLMADIIFGDIRLKDVSRHVVIPSYQLDNNAKHVEERKSDVILFHNIVPNKDSDVKLTEACLRSSAAPTYFRCFQGYVDGGVFANNPSACAWPLLLGAPPNGLSLNATDLVCLSLGTGASHKRHIDDERLIDGGAYQWGMNILTLFNNAALDFNNMTGRMLLGERFYRYTPFFGGQGPIKLDNWKCAPILKNFAEKIPMEPIFAWIEKNWF